MERHKIKEDEAFTILTHASTNQHQAARRGRRARPDRRSAQFQLTPVLHSVIMTVVILQSIFIYNDFHTPRQATVRHCDGSVDDWAGTRVCASGVRAERLLGWEAIAVRRTGRATLPG